jgi:hypothetical protein
MKNSNHEEIFVRNGSPAGSQFPRWMLSNKNASYEANFIIYTSLPLINYGRFV